MTTKSLKAIFCLFLLTGFLTKLGAQQATQVSRVGMTVSDMDKALAFYEEVLNFEKVSDIEVYGQPYEELYGLFGLRFRTVRLKLGDETIELTDYLTPGGRPIPVDSKSNDLWFQHLAIVVADMDQAYERLRQHGIQMVSTAPQTIPASNKAAAGIRAFYFRDPDGHNLELIFFPPGKGKEKWQQSGGNLFLGIDHTAIAVSNSANSLKFYQELLGLQLAGESFNFGTEQAHLNNVEHASLHITGLKTNQGPGIEFLEYLEPSDGRPFPQDTRADDLWQWQTTLVVRELNQALQSIRQDEGLVVSKGLIELENDPLDLKKGVMVRDPDGHALLLVEELSLSVIE